MTGSDRSFAAWPGHPLEGAVHGPKRSFWSTVPGILTGVATLITALGGLLGLLVQQKVINLDESRPSEPTVTSTAGAPPTTAPQATIPKLDPSVTTRPQPTSPPLTIGPTPSSTRITTSSSTVPPSSVPTGFRIVETFLRADVEQTGPCPAVIRFSGRISVAGGGGTVSYRFLRSDGASAPVRTQTFDGPGSADVETTWTRGEGSGWQQLEILDPHPARSRQATFTVTCA